MIFLELSDNPESCLYCIHCRWSCFFQDYICEFSSYIDTSQFERPKECPLNKKDGDINDC